MKKIILTSVLILSIFGYSQVGIGTDTPHSSSILELEASDKAFVLTRVANTAAVPDPINGMVIYDNSSNCIKVYENNSWSDCLSNEHKTSVAANCDINGFIGDYNRDIPLDNSNKFSVTISNDSFSVATIVFEPGDLILSGISGVSVASVAPASITLNPGQSQLIKYSLTGTPTSSGMMTGTWNKLSLNCNKTVLVDDLVITSLDCSGASHVGSLSAGSPAMGVYSEISYTGGDGSVYDSQTIASTGVTGLIASLGEGAFASGNGSVIYEIMGTPSSAGTANFAINLGGKSCTLTRTVTSFIPNNISLVQAQKHFILSVNDDDYLPYIEPVGPATISVVNADNITETLINYQGTITTTGISLKIPITATGSGTLPAYSQTINIPAAYTEDGIARDLEFSWTAQAYTQSTKKINANIKSIGGTLNTKRLDINSGVGNDGLGVMIGQFNYPFNSNGNISNFDVRIIAGIPDKMFGVADNNNNKNSHKMLYLPIMGDDGKIWLNNNLGANYSNMNSAYFNPTQQPTSYDDYNGYGSLFQGGRKPDGHELVSWINSNTATVTGTTTTLSNSPGHAKFIISNSYPSDWRVDPNANLWLYSSANNPCPKGFRPPTETELTNFKNSANLINSTTAYESDLKLTTPGFRYFGSGYVKGAVNAMYWSNTGSGVGNSVLAINPNGASISGNPRARGYSVRCIKN